MSASAPTIPTLSRPRTRAAAQHLYEVDDDAGRCLYRGADLGLADEICGSGPGLHLVVLACAA
ncbi:MAG TPA: hypothetical protein VGD11_10840 [Mycobacteriales bacterium]